MGKDLTVSSIERQNVLNNRYAVEQIQKAAQIQGVVFEDRVVVLKDQIVDFFEVTPRTIENYLSRFEAELRQNGYEVLRGKRLESFKSALKDQYANEIDFGTKTTVLGIFDFRAFLNIAMLITESERARLLRQTILDIVIDTINQRTGGATKYVNQRDADFVHAYFREENYRKEFTDALRDFVAMGKFKYPVYTDKIYVGIFRENAREYRKILRLKQQDKVRDTFYSEILDLISSYEYGFAKVLEQAFLKKGERLAAHEVDALFREFENQPHWKPLIESARIKMASRDLAFRDALHLQLTEYLTPLQADEFERFIGEKSKELVERMEEARDVFKRLKERG